MPIFPGTEANLLDGPIRVLRAPTTVAVPTRISEVINVVGPDYAPKTGWIDCGFTTEDETEYERDMDSEQLRVDQRTGSVLERITEINRSFTVPFAEITPELMQIAEEGSAIATLAAIGGPTNTGKGAEKAVDFGSFESLTRYRFALIAQRDKSIAGTVTETGNAAVTRGPFVGLLLYSCALAAEGSSMAVQRGELTNREITFAVYPESTIIDPAKQHGRYVQENAGQTIATV